tara:strand:+ start:9322 stop:9480 length:159 start_codon:yes stop_codon:yes gene_type:complete
MAEKINKDEKSKKLTTKEKIEALKNQQEQLREAYLKAQGAIEILEAIENEDK